MIRKLLIANRGEIAARVITTAREMGIATVAVYSDADAGALHVEMADEAVRIGPPSVAESYLNTDAILAAAKATGADAIHPGYGFLSENPDFVDAVEAAGLVFVGPPASAIRAMGLKDAAKAAMQDAGVPVVPGYHDEAQDTETLAKAADQIGYPVLIKARAGGGGKGMRLVEDPKDFADALAGAQREGQASFGDPGVLVEKYITTPRHIEIQVFADGHGNVVHLFERDCSLQRRHQKVIEEAPAPHMPVDVREAMGQAAVEAARAIGYQGAGTVEFIVDGSGPLRADGFWFMEMNTRLQVEHPVTEAITGLDLVALQLQVASGAALPFRQSDLAISGHAFEARIYAEDVTAGFLPATGHIDYFATPKAAHFRNAPIRIDTGIRAGDDVTPHYDPMIAKLIVHGADRAQALARLTKALNEMHIAGTVTNTSFLGRRARHEGFAEGQVDTGLIARDLGPLTASPSAKTLNMARMAAALQALDLLRDVDENDPWDALTGWRAWGHAVHRVSLFQDGDLLEHEVTFHAGSFTIDGTPVEATKSGDMLRLTMQNRTERLAVHRNGRRITVFTDGETLVFTLPDPLDRDAAGGAAADHILAPMPGLVTQVTAAKGDTVTEGQPLLVLEAMKMEHTLKAPRDGVIAEMLASSGDQVSNGALLVQFESESDD